VAATTPPPLGGTPRRVLFRKDSWLAQADDREPLSAEWYAVSAGYFETVQIPVLQGRTRQDAPSTPQVAIINASMAARYWPNENPIGRLLQTDVLDDPPRQIVGVVGDVDATISVSSARTVEDYAADQLQELSQYAAVWGVFGAMSVTLAVIDPRDRARVTSAGPREISAPRGRRCHPAARWHVDGPSSRGQFAPRR
jgi:hypothetical protein